MLRGAGARQAHPILQTSRGPLEAKSPISPSTLPVTQEHYLEGMWNNELILRTKKQAAFGQAQALSPKIAKQTPQPQPPKPLKGSEAIPHLGGYDGHLCETHPGSSACLVGRGSCCSLGRP